nr:MAG TPA: hypothetical protein [Caudoviricetes sp.]
MLVASRTLFLFLLQELYSFYLPQKILLLQICLLHFF